MTQLCKLMFLDYKMQTQSQVHTLRSWNSAAVDMAVLQTADWFIIAIKFGPVINDSFSSGVNIFKVIFRWVQLLGIA